MCQCTPEIRTPFCGKPGCEWPPQIMRAPTKRPFERHDWLAQVLRQIEELGASPARMESLKSAIDAALNHTGNSAYVRGQIDQHDEPLPSDVIARFKQTQGADQ